MPEEFGAHQKKLSSRQKRIPLPRLSSSFALSYLTYKILEHLLHYSKVSKTLMPYEKHDFALKPFCLYPLFQCLANFPSQPAYMYSSLFHSYFLLDLTHSMYPRLPLETHLYRKMLVPYYPNPAINTPRHFAALPDPVFWYYNIYILKVNCSMQSNLHHVFFEIMCSTSGTCWIDASQ